MTGRSAAPKRAPRVPFALLVTGLVVGGLALLLALNTASAANELRRHDLATQDAAVSAQVQQLQIDVAASAAPGNLAAVATQLGMVPAGHPAFLVIGADGTVRLMGRPKAVSAAPVPIPPAPHHPKKPKKAAAPSPTSTSTPGASPTKPAASKSAAPNSRASRTTAKRSAAALPAPPTPTPTPVVTLPGGAR
ncbi:MAG TPA: hypothetical protein VGN18_07305 [Jatrophihabitans sp.]|jgi:hypothetical protein|uniref:hypothetical protein n=1 Tax=Jatrophihabitans sp. TaxID=1932789 RepID=UPI002E08D130|nr:hypothetical protein [Jatrophihabitans sp.]